MPTPISYVRNECNKHSYYIVENPSTNKKKNIVDALAHLYLYLYNPLYYTMLYYIIPHYTIQYYTLRYSAPLHSTCCTLIYALSFSFHSFARRREFRNFILDSARLDSTDNDTIYYPVVSYPILSYLLLYAIFKYAEKWSSLSPLLLLFPRHSIASATLCCTVLYSLLYSTLIYSAHKHIRV